MAAAAYKPEPTASQPMRGFPGLRCPLCGHENSVSLDLDYLSTFRCSECSDEISVKDVRELVSKWQAVLSWIDMAPIVLE